MCGIVGLVLKDPDLRPLLGGLFETMLVGMSERGPDSAGMAVYHRPTTNGACKLTAFHPEPGFAWRQVAGDMAQALDVETDVEVRANHAVITVAAEVGPARRWFADHRPDVRVMGYGGLMEVYKDMGLPGEVVGRYGVAEMAGTHAVGHTRMATESAVTTEHSHPFTADSDMCLVHNGSLSNHNRLRRWLERHGMTFETDNDTEVAARYVAYRLGEGATLHEALEAAIRDLDGFYTFTVGTRDGFAVLRDGFACKPAVLAETDGWVAMASEFRSLAHLPGVDGAHIWEPEPLTIYTWDVSGGTTA